MTREPFVLGIFGDVDEAGNVRVWHVHYTTSSSVTAKHNPPWSIEEALGFLREVQESRSTDPETPETR